MTSASVAPAIGGRSTSPAASPEEPDFTVVDHGPLWTFTPKTETAQEWWSANIHMEGMARGGAYVARHQAAREILTSIQESGLSFIQLSPGA